jgi:hypothetical protein
MASRVVFRQRPRSTVLLLFGVEVLSLALLVALHSHELVDVPPDRLPRGGSV